MRKIDTWLFIVFLIALYFTFFWLLGFASGSLFASLVLAPENSFYIISVIAFAISFLAYFLAAFGLRSYYLLPTSLTRLATIVVAVQLILGMVGMLFERQLTFAGLGSTLVSAIVTWLAVYLSFKISDRYFSK